MIREQETLHTYIVTDTQLALRDDMYLFDGREITVMK